MSYIEVNHAHKVYRQDDAEFVALEDVTFSVDKGEFICLLGPSGCGKTTLLNALAGFEQLDAGSVTIDGEPVTGPRSDRVTIFQDYGLLPWQSVEKNVMLGLTARHEDKKRAREIANTYLTLVGLEKFKDRRPGQLSGGQKQRVSIARALAVSPKILFMDEPFAALDAITRLKMQDDIRRIAEEQGITVIFVTHDIEEAVFLADRIVVLTPNPGRLKALVPVDLGQEGGRRDRTSDDFLLIRDRIYEIFRMKQERKIEYYI